MEPSTISLYLASIEQQPPTCHDNLVVRDTKALVRAEPLAALGRVRPLRRRRGGRPFHARSAILSSMPQNPYEAPQIESHQKPILFGRREIGRCVIGFGILIVACMAWYWYALWPEIIAEQRGLAGPLFGFGALMFVAGGTVVVAGLGIVAKSRGTGLFIVAIILTWSSCFAVSIVRDHKHMRKPRPIPSQTAIP